MPQRESRAGLIGRGERVIGWKVGFTTPLQERHGVTSRCWLPARLGVFGSGGRGPGARFVRRVEVEVAFLLKGLAGPGVTRSRVARDEGAMRRSS